MLLPPALADKDVSCSETPRGEGEISHPNSARAAPTSGKGHRCLLSDFSLHVFIYRLSSWRAASCGGLGVATMFAQHQSCGLVWMGLCFSPSLSPSMSGLGRKHVDTLHAAGVVVSASRCTGKWWMTAVLHICLAAICISAAIMAILCWVVHFNMVIHVYCSMSAQSQAEQKKQTKKKALHSSLWANRDYLRETDPNIKTMTLFNVCVYLKNNNFL